MLANLKSSYFCIILFSHLNKRNKLKMIKYNKNWQNIMKINIKHYQIFSEKYIIYESKNKGKEYKGFNDFLIYEGNYLNCKRNGQGKEYNEKGELIYEGEFKNGKRNGKGKTFKYSKEILYEGEFLDDDLKFGKEYDENGKIIKEIKENGFRKMINNKDEIIFEGEYLNGKRNGKGKEYSMDYPNNLLFEGEYLNGKRHGEGKEYTYKNNKLYSFFEGEYLNGKRNGTGKTYLKVYQKPLIFVGFDENPNNNTKKKEDKPDKILIAEGEYFDGKEWNIRYYDRKGDLLYELKNGNGIVKDVYEYRNPIIKFEKTFLNGEANGKGKEFEENGKLKFEGEYIDNHRIKGKEYINGRLEYEGEYLFDKKYNGKGYDENGNIIYELINGDGKVIMYYEDSLRFEGELLKGRRNGKGKVYQNNILIFDSEYKDGQANGKTKLYDTQGKIIYDGEFRDGLKNGMGKEYFDGELIYEGEFKDSLWSGKGKNYCDGKLKFESEFLEGRKHGKGKEYNEEGRVVFEGEYLNGRRWNGEEKVYRILCKDKLKFILKYANGIIVDKIKVPI